MKNPLVKVILSSVCVLSVLIVSFLILTDDMDEYQWRGSIKIGMIAPLSGSGRSGGVSMQTGTELAVKNINDNGGVNGYKIELVVIDDRGVPSLSEEAAKELIYIDGVEAIIGPFSSDCCLAIKGLINSSGTPLITPVAMSDLINREDDYVFRNTMGVTQAQIKVNSYSNMLRGEYIMLDGLGAGTLGILWQNDVWGQEMQQAIVDDLSFIKREDDLLFNESFQLGQEDYSQHFESKKDNFPDLIYVVSSGDESIALLKSAREAGYTGLFLGEGGFNYSNFDKELGSYA